MRCAKMQKQIILIIGSSAAGHCRMSEVLVSRAQPRSLCRPAEPPLARSPARARMSLSRTNPFANDPVALQEGHKLFNWYNCSGCHGGHAGGGMGPSLRDKVWLFGDRDDQIFDSIAEGRGEGMPSWGTKIPEEQIWKLVAYIKSMRTSMNRNRPKCRPTNKSRLRPSFIHPSRRKRTSLNASLCPSVVVTALGMPEIAVYALSQGPAADKIAHLSWFMLILFLAITASMWS